MAIDTLSLDFGRDKPFYVYVYRDPRPGKRNAPIYVGKGLAANGRADLHWKYKSHNPILNAIFAKIRKLNLEPAVEIVGWFDVEDQAFALEIALIERFGRRDIKTGSLANLTTGGEGSAGRSDEINARIAESVSRTKSKMFDLISANSKAYYANASPEKLAEHRMNKSIAAKANSADISAHLVTMWADPVHRAVRSRSISVSQASSWADPIKGAARRAKLNATYARKRAIREATKAAAALDAELQTKAA